MSHPSPPLSQQECVQRASTAAGEDRAERQKERAASAHVVCIITVHSATRKRPPSLSFSSQKYTQLTTRIHTLTGTSARATMRWRRGTRGAAGALAAAAGRTETALVDRAAFISIVAVGVCATGGARTNRTSKILDWLSLRGVVVTLTKICS